MYSTELHTRVRPQALAATHSHEARSNPTPFSVAGRARRFKIQPSDKALTRFFPEAQPVANHPPPPPQPNTALPALDETKHWTSDTKEERDNPPGDGHPAGARVWVRGR